MSVKLSFLMTALCGLMFLTGCSDTDPAPETVGVSGTIYLNDEPLANAEVRFITEGFSSFGQTGPDGRYELVQGAVPGVNTVAISKMEGGGDFEINPDEGMDAGQLEAMQMGMDTGGGSGRPAVDIPRQVIPADYSDPSTSKLTYTVPEGGTTSADLRISSQ